MKTNTLLSQQGGAKPVLGSGKVAKMNPPIFCAPRGNLVVIICSQFLVGSLKKHVQLTQFRQMIDK